MTHFTVTVAIPADTPAPHLYGALSAALEPFSENLDVEPYVKLTAAQIAADSEFQAFWAKLNDDNPDALLSFAEAASDWFGGELREDGNLWSTWNRDGHWDWWVIGGRWAGEWLLTPGAQRALEPERSSFGFTDESADPRRTDAARKGEIEPDSIAVSHAYIDIDGQWHHQGRMGWFATCAEEMSYPDWAASFTAWVQSLHADVWLVKVDAHI